jgi:hypothetical protein
MEKSCSFVGVGTGISCGESRGLKEIIVAYLIVRKI